MRYGELPAPTLRELAAVARDLADARQARVDQMDPDAGEQPLRVIDNPASGSGESRSGTRTPPAGRAPARS